MVSPELSEILIIDPVTRDHEERQRSIATHAPDCPTEERGDGCDFRMVTIPASAVNKVIEWEINVMLLCSNGWRPLRR